MQGRTTRAPTSSKYNGDFDVAKSTNSEKELHSSPRPTSIAALIDHVMAGSNSKKKVAMESYDNPLKNGSLIFETINDINNMSRMIKDVVSCSKTPNPHGVIGDARKLSKESLSLNHTSPWRTLFDYTNAIDKGLDLSFVCPSVTQDECIASVNVEEVQ